MRFGAAFRAIVKPLTRNLRPKASESTFIAPCSSFPFHASLTVKPHSLVPYVLAIVPTRHFSIFEEINRFDPLTDTRYPKRRPQYNPGRKRASLRRKGAFAWVNYVPGEPIQRGNPNKGSVKRRNARKRMMQHITWVKSEAKKRKAQMQEAKQKKLAKRVERKMAATARDRDWAQRLVELKRLEEEKKD